MMNKIKTKIQKHKFFTTILQSTLIVALILLVIIMMMQINRLQGTARVINYAGIVRGATQREVKLEVTGNANNELIQYLDDILNGLKYENGNYDLIRLEDADYQQKLSRQIDYWELLKKEIQKVRSVGYRDTDIVEMSEAYFKLADETVSSAEVYSEKIAKILRVLEIFSAVIMAGLILLIIEQYFYAMNIAKKNKILEKKAYIDLHTGLPNKSKCEELLHNVEFIHDSLACIMFDLNNLKKANDTMGHSVGDQLILNFSRILRNVIPAKDFVGRYGGDEFMVVLYGKSRSQAEQIMEDLQEEIEHFNQCGNNFPISYAYGCAFSSDYTECTLRTLLDNADSQMYHNKRKGKLGNNQACT